MSVKIDIESIIEELLGKASAESRLHIDLIFDDPRFVAVKKQTLKNRLKAFIQNNPEFLDRISGFFPTPETVIGLAAKRLGGITEESLPTANQICRRIMLGISKPAIEKFLRESLSAHFVHETNKFNVDSGALVQFLLDDFSAYLKASGNSLVSLAGSINEKLLHSALESAGLSTGTDFSITGKDSNADLVIHSRVGAKENLGVEVKSYHARERLLRGLKDVKDPKIGVGYFQDPGEFNRTRTQALLQAQPAAIYMPGSTLHSVQPQSRSMESHHRLCFDSVLYRPLERFASDMKYFTEHGKLPRFVWKKLN